MPFIIYSGGKSHGIVDFNTADAGKYYVRHYENWLILCDIFAHETDKMRRRQANSEIRVAQRKMDFWMRHKNFEPTEVARKMSQIRLENARKHMNEE